MVALHEDVSAFITISRWILRKMRSVSDKRRGENENTHLMLSNFPPPPKIVPFVRYIEKYGAAWGAADNTGARCIQKLSISFSHSVFMYLIWSLQ
jgi:hypothetical protein